MSTVADGLLRTIHSNAPSIHHAANVAEPAKGPRAVAYLVNTYPRISHSFIGTEMAALERRGLAVHRFAFRRSNEDFEDASFAAEARQTQILLERGPIKLMADIVACISRRPRASLAAMALARRMSGRGNFLRACACFAEAAALARILNRSGVKHVHAHFGTNSAAVARLAARLAPLTYSFTAHGPEEFDSPLALDLPGKIAEAAFVAGVSSFGRGQLMRWSAPEHWHRVQVVPCAAAPAFLEPARPFPTDHAPTRLLCVARLDAQKGLPLLVEAVGKIAAKRDIVVEIFGEGPGRAFLEAEIARNGLEANICLLGWGTPRQIRERIRGARAFVLPSFAEGLPVVLMEAMALRRPVIATAIAGISELVDSQVGWLVPSGSAEALAEAMEAALDAEPHTLRAMGDEGRRRVLERHHPDRVAAGLVPLLEPFL